MSPIPLAAMLAALDQLEARASDQMRALTARLEAAQLSGRPDMTEDEVLDVIAFNETVRRRDSLRQRVEQARV